MTILKRTSLLLVLGACLAAAGCGSNGDKGDPIPAQQAQLLERRLDETQNRLANGSVGACEDVLNDTRPGVQTVLASVPKSVDPDVRDALAQSFDNLWSLVDSECADKADKPSTETTPPETTPTTPPETTPTTPPETTPTTPPETDTNTTPDQQPLPPEGDGNNGGAIPPAGDGNGGGGVGPSDEGAGQ